MWWPFSAADSATGSSIKVPESDAPLQPSKENLRSIVKQPLSREEQADVEFAEFLKEIEIEQAKTHEERYVGKSDGKPGFTIAADISPDALYPTTMSCRSSFDYAMFCQSFGGQFVNVYRYGEFRSCSNHWNDFWMCMRTRQWDPKDKTKAIQDHFRNKAIKWKTGPSSEDIWEVRTEPVKDPFQDSLEELEAKIEQWKVANPGATDPWAKQPATTFSNPPPSV